MTLVAQLPTHLEFPSCFPKIDLGRTPKNASHGVSLVAQRSYLQKENKIKYKCALITRMQGNDMQTIKTHKFPKLKLDSSKTAPILSRCFHSKNNLIIMQKVLCNGLNKFIIYLVLSIVVQGLK